MMKIGHFTHVLYGGGAGSEGRQGCQPCGKSTKIIIEYGLTDPPMHCFFISDSHIS